jgi:hypothetical protein
MFTALMQAPMTSCCEPPVKAKVWLPEAAAPVTTVGTEVALHPFAPVIVTV